MMYEKVLAAIIKTFRIAYGFTVKAKEERPTSYGWSCPTVPFKFSYTKLFFRNDEIAEGLRMDYMLVIADTYYMTLTEYDGDTYVVLVGGNDNIPDFVASCGWNFKKFAFAITKAPNWEKAFLGLVLDRPMYLNDTVIIAVRVH